MGPRLNPEGKEGAWVDKHPQTFILRAVGFSADDRVDSAAVERGLADGVQTP